MSQKFKLGLVLYLLGFIGVLSMLTVTLPLPEEFTARFSEPVQKLLVISGPAVYLLVAVIAGTLLYDKAGLTVPTISSFLKIEGAKSRFGEQLKSGIILGVIAGIFIIAVQLIFQSAIPDSFKELGEDVQLTVAARLLYGGITEELLMRFGLMTLFVWLLSKFAKRLNASVYWFGILLAALLFAAGHLPVVYLSVPDPGTSLILYVLIGNTVPGIFFGWLYWKKGLEAAFIAHMFTHVAMLAGEQVFNLG